MKPQSVQFGRFKLKVLEKHTQSPRNSSPPPDFDSRWMIDCEEIVR